MQRYSYRFITSGAHRASLPYTPPLAGFAPFLWLRAFAAGCTALTGVETISKGVQSFYPPETTNARKTMLWMGGLLAFLFGGISFLTRAFGIVPCPGERVSAQLHHGQVPWEAPDLVGGEQRAGGGGAGDPHAPKGERLLCGGDLLHGAGTQARGERLLGPSVVGAGKQLVSQQAKISSHSVSR